MAPLMLVRYVKVPPRPLLYAQKGEFCVLILINLHRVLVTYRTYKEGLGMAIRYLTTSELHDL
jgi:hypothetical protein